MNLNNMAVEGGRVEVALWGEFHSNYVFGSSVTVRAGGRLTVLAKEALLPTGAIRLPNLLIERGAIAVDDRARQALEVSGSFGDLQSTSQSGFHDPRLPVFV